MLALRTFSRAAGSAAAGLRHLPRAWYSEHPEQKYKVRRAELEDREKIMNLGSDNPSVDRLPAFYDTLIKDRHRHCFILERWGELVAYSHGHVVDGGSTLAFHDLRLGKDETNREKYRFLLTYSTIKEVQELYPALENTTMVLSEEKDAVENLDAVYKVVGKQQYHAIQISPEEVPTLIEEVHTSIKNDIEKESKRPAPSYLTPSEAVTVATRVSGISSFFGGDRIILMGESYKPTQDNFISARGIFKHILATFESKKDLKALSFRNTFSHEGDTIQTLDVFSESKDLFMDHFKLQIVDALADTKDGPLQLFVQIPSVMSKEELTDFCVSDLGIPEKGVKPLGDYVLGEISCNTFQQAAAAHLSAPQTKQ